MGAGQTKWLWRRSMDLSEEQWKRIDMIHHQLLTLGPIKPRLHPWLIDSWQPLLIKALQIKDYTSFTIRTTLHKTQEYFNIPWILIQFLQDEAHWVAFHRGNIVLPAVFCCRYVKKLTFNEISSGYHFRVHVNKLLWQLTFSFLFNSLTPSFSLLKLLA